MPFGPAIIATTGLDTSGLKAGAAQAEGVVLSFTQRTAGLFKDLGSSITQSLVAGFGVYQLISFAREALQSAAQLTNLSRELGVSTEAIQAFDRAMRLTGGTSEQAQKVWERARDALDQLASGEAKATEEFAALGLSAQDFVGLNLEESLEKIAQGYVKNEQTAGAYNAVLEIIGKRGGPQALQALKELGAEGLDPLEQKMGGADGQALQSLAKALIDIKDFALDAKNAFIDLFGYVAAGARKFGVDAAVSFGFAKGLSDDELSQIVVGGNEPDQPKNPAITENPKDVAKDEAEQAKQDEEAARNAIRINEQEANRQEREAVAAARLASTVERRTGAGEAAPAGLAGATFAGDNPVFRYGYQANSFGVGAAASAATAQQQATGVDPLQKVNESLLQIVEILRTTLEP